MAATGVGSAEPIYSESITLLDHDGGSVGEQSGGSAHDDRGAEAQGDDGVGSELPGLVRQPVRGRPAGRRFFPLLVV